MREIGSDRGGLQRGGPQGEKPHGLNVELKYMCGEDKMGETDRRNMANL